MYKIPKDKIPRPPEKPFVQKMPVPQIPNDRIINSNNDYDYESIILIILIILSSAYCVYTFINKDNYINNLNTELENVKRSKDNKINDLRCNCPSIPECPKCPDPPQCPTTICPTCPSSHEIVESLFPGRSLLPSDFYNFGNQGNKEMEILDTDNDKYKNYIVSQSLDVEKNYKEVIDNIKNVLGDKILLDQKVSE
uniref:Uncharacterized protein n=1 Tax=viral metagenome TaxID=1070528 RepID=A0A6C0CXX0_9ZZZZ